MSNITFCPDEEVATKRHKKAQKDNEKYYTIDGELIFEVDPKFYRPAEVHELCGDPTLAENEMGWVRKTDFAGLVKKMYQSDYMLLSR